MRALLFAGLVTIAAAAALAACSGGGDRAEEAQATPALIAPTASVPAGPPSATIAPAAAAELIVVSDGATDELLLEWTGGPANATKWQYRRTTWNQKRNVPNPWGDWTDIPGSTASTRSYLLTGLSSATGHRFEVRAVVGTTAGEASNRAHGITHTPGEYPRINPGKIVEGDGRTEWRVAGLKFVVTIPDGVRIKGGRGITPAGMHQPAITMSVVAPYRAGLLFSYDGDVLNRHIPVPEGSGSAAIDMRAAEALLDKIVKSLRRLD